LDLGDLPGGANASRANAASRWGVVVGESAVLNGGHAFRWEQASGMQDLGDLPGGAEASAAFAIMDTARPNNGAPPPPGAIVGYGTNAQGRRAVGWQAGATGAPQPIDLNTLINPGDQLRATTVLEEARGINRYGVISAFGRISGAPHVLLLVPADADTIPTGAALSPFQEFCVGTFTL
jgi:probable HAF family extracellular repeat protein